MVNIGRPSGGCDVCKKRKVRCDQTRPYCHRCQKAGRDCGGVPTDFIVNLREASRRKDTSTKASKLLESSNLYTEATRTAMEVPSICSYPTVEGELQFPVEQQALSLLFHDYTFVPFDVGLRNRPFFLLPRLHAASTQSEPLQHAVSAVALHMLARCASAPHLKAAGNLSYLRGLRALRRALESPKHALSDSVLGAIVMLKVFEMHAASFSLKTYCQHAAGATAILKARGKTQFENPDTLRLFRTCRTQVITAAIESGVTLSVVDDSFDWFGDKQIPDETSHNSRLMEIAYHVCSIRRRVDEWLDPLHPTLPDFATTAWDYEGPWLGTFSAGESLEREEVLSRFLVELDGVNEALDAWFGTLPAEWWPSTVPVEGYDDDVWNKTTYFFQRPLSAALHTFAHSLRIIVNGLHIKTQLRRGRDVAVSTRYHIRGSADFISATVPYVFGSDALVLPWRKQFLDPGSWMKGHAIFHCNPIFFAAAVGDCVPLAQRKWLKGRLEYLAIKAGYFAAGALAARLPFPAAWWAGSRSILCV